MNALARYVHPILVFVLTYGFCLIAYRPWRIYFFGDTWALLADYTENGLKAIFHPHNEHFLPVAQFLLYWEFSVFGMNASLFALVSLAIHSANAVLVYVLSGRVTDWPWARVFGALFFGCSGLLFEAVIWECAQEITLALGFGLLSLICAARHMDTDRVEWAVAAAVALACSVLSHTFGFVSVPLLVLFWGRRNGRAALTDAAFAVVTYVVLLRVFGDWQSMAGPASESRRVTSLELMLRWTWLAVSGGVKPLLMAPLNPMAVAAVIAVPVLLWQRERLRRGLELAVVAGALALLPHALSGLGRAVRFGLQTADDERYHYLPTAGAALLMAWIVGAAATWARGRGLRLLLATSLLAHALFGVWYVGNHSPWPYWHMQMTHFLDRMVTGVPQAPPPGMMEVAGEPLLSHFASPNKFPLPRVLRMYQRAGWPVEPDRPSIRSYLDVAAVRRMNLLEGRRWRVSGDARVEDKDGVLSLDIPEAGSSVSINLEEFSVEKPAYSFIADARLASKDYNTEMRIVFLGPDGGVVDSVGSEAFGLPEFRTIIVTALAPVGSSAVRVEFAPAMPGKRPCRVQARNILVLRHPIYVPANTVAHTRTVDRP